MRKVTIRHWNWLVAVEYEQDGWQSRLAAVKSAIETQDRSALATHRAEVIKEYEETATAFGGHLQRNIIGQWAWSDGTPEPRVRDLRHQDCFNFRCRTDGEQVYVEVPKKQATGDLEWVRAGGYDVEHSGDHEGMRVLHEDGRTTRGYMDPESGETTGARVIPQVYLVPSEIWDKWAYQCIGAQWMKSDEPAIFEKARSLGATL